MNQRFNIQHKVMNAREMTSALRILHLEDDPFDAQLIKSILENEGISCRICLVASHDDFIAALDREKFDIIVSDYSLPDFDGFRALALVKEKRPHIPFIFVTGEMGEEFVIEMLKSGATDYVMKNNIARLVPSVQRALRKTTERSERKKVRKSDNGMKL